MPTTARELAPINTEEEMLVALLSQDDPVSVARRVVYARQLPIEKRLGVLRELEAEMMRDLDRADLDEAETTAAQVKEIRSLVSSLYAQARDDFADRREGEAIGDPGEAGDASSR